MNIRNVSIKDYEKIKILFKRHNMNMIDFKRWVNLWKKNPSLKNNKIKGIIMLSPAIDPNSEEYFWVGNFAKWKATRWLVPRAFVVAADEKYAHAEELKTMESLWKKIPVPVLILHGKKDFLAPYKNMEYVEDYFPKTLLNSITLPNENHFIPWTKQQLIIKEIDSLIQNIQ